MRRLRIIVVFLVATAAALDVRAGANLTPPALLPAHEGKESCRPAAAFGKDVFLVVWQAVNAPQSADLVACRVDKSGKVLDAKPFVVSGAADDQERPRIAFAPGGGGGGGGVFLVVWQDLRNEKDYDTYAARVSPDGKVLDADGILIAGGAGNQSRPRVAFDGTNFLVVWEDMRNGKCYEVYGARVSAGGKLLDAGGVLLNSGKGLNRYMPAAASFGDGRTLVVWCGTKYWGGHGTAAGSLFVRDGKVEKENGKLEGIKDRNGGIGGGGRGGTPVSAVAGKEGYLVLWRNHRPVGRAGGGGRSNCALFIDREGNWKKGESLSLTGKPHVTMDPDAAWDGSGFVVAWTEQPSARGGPGMHEVVVAARTDAKGQPAGGAIPIAGSFAAPANRVAVASDGAGTSLIAYMQHPKTAVTPIRIGFRLLKK